jgi:hypothetical protein
MTNGTLSFFEWAKLATPPIEQAIKVLSTLSLSSILFTVMENFYADVTQPKHDACRIYFILGEKNS